MVARTNGRVNVAAKTVHTRAAWTPRQDAGALEAAVTTWGYWLLLGLTLLAWWLEFSRLAKFREGANTL